jgi:hypothetical protein
MIGSFTVYIVDENVARTESGRVFVLFSFYVTSAIRTITTSMVVVINFGIFTGNLFHHRCESKRDVNVMCFIRRECTV